MKTPDFTPVQMVVAAVASTIGLLVSFGIGISPEQTNAILAFVGTMGGLALAADAYIRNGRAKMAAAIESNKVILGGLDN
jgi:hypothetical protein